MASASTSKGIIMSVDWLPGVAISVITTIAGGSILWWRQISVSNAVFDTRINALRESDKNIVDDFRAISKSLQDVTIAAAATTKEQAIINTMMTKALEGIVTKLDSHTEKLAEAGATVEILKEILSKFPSFHKRID